MMDRLRLAKGPPPILNAPSVEVCRERVGSVVADPSIQSGRSLFLMHWFADRTNALDSHAMVLIKGTQVSFESAVGAR
jgi:hypothetical protein